MQLTKTRLQSGVWEGVLSGSSAGATPALSVTHLNVAVPEVSLSALPDGGWAVRIPVPLAAVADGVQTIVISDPATGETLDSFALIGGEALSEDIRAEMDLLRAELDMLKRAFRRHCVETA